MAKKEKSVWKEVVKVIKGPYRVTTGAVVAAVIGGLIKLADITKTFPGEAGTVANVIIFIAVLFVVADICKGGLFD
jgi:hypothetical protein